MGRSLKRTIRLHSPSAKNEEMNKSGEKEL